jgi:D-methionine transport system substrate-binding protein
MQSSTIKSSRWGGVLATLLLAVSTLAVAGPNGIKVGCRPRRKSNRCKSR